MTVPFAMIARRHFDPVAQRFGLSLVEATERALRYENPEVFLRVNFDNGRSYELGVELGQTKAPDTQIPFSLAEVLRLRRVPGASSIDGIMVSDADRLSNALAQLADLTLLHATDFLSNSSFAFAQVAKLRADESKQFSLEQDLRIARSKAEAAWSLRHHRDVITALSPVEAHLSPAEKKRLDYCRKHVARDETG